ncbi:LysR family transcriptional regulator [Parasulfitobacter algicola]|uniref:LysR family transcriptional regulator n=1 Tax=Parasulfitobacter algicola TaxID=2614809 RepID=A0ABX2ISE3_9RHOB|nr:LysR family transcriptional regulator [Sulfitobacter algicola]NSX53707.1 LysR family transcriptional regulator [Sulfitobacter algicola]
MRLEWLEDILAVVETGSFSEAAERRFLTQSAFSRRIRMIEESIGIELFDRTRKPVQLNAATAEQEPRIRELSDALRSLVHDLRQQEKNAANHIIVVSQHALATTHTPQILKHLVTQDNLTIRLRSANWDDCFAQLITREAQIAVTYRAPADELPGRDGVFDIIDMGQEQLIAVATFEHATNELPVVAYPRDVYLGQLCERAIFPGFRISRRVETALTTAALELARNGIGIAWVPATLARSALRDGSLKQLTDLPSLSMQVIAARLSGKHNKAEIRAWDHLPKITF